MNSRAKRVLHNLGLGLVAQGFSLVLSVVMGLVVPKFLGVEEFGYWQFFTFISTYVCFFHLGIVDGVLLRYAGQPFESLQHPLLFSQLLAMLLFQAVAGSGVLVLLAFWPMPWQYRLIFSASCIFMLLINTGTYMCYLFQASDNTRWYSFSVLVQKWILLAVTLLMLVFRVDYFWVLVGGNLLAVGGTVLYCLIKGRLLFSGGLEKNRPLIKQELVTNIRVGSKLLLSFISSSLILGLGKLAVSLRWNIESFGQFAFALSLTNMFLVFAGQFGLVLFPVVKKIDPDSVAPMYTLADHIASLLLCGMLLFYLPAKLLLTRWLPQYESSFLYFTLAVAMVLYDGKMNMVNNVFLKALREEKAMLVINLCGVALSAVLVGIAAFGFSSIFLVMAAVVVATILRSMAFECYLSRLLKRRFVPGMLAELGLVLFFVIFVALGESFVALGVYAALYGVYTWSRRRSLHQLRTLLRNTKEPG